MKKRILSILTSCAIFLSISGSFGSVVLAEPTTVAPMYESDEAGHGDIKIYTYSSSGDLHGFVMAFLERNPDLDEKYRVITYRPNRGALDYYSMTWTMLGGDTPADIYLSELDYLYDFVDGEFASISAPYSDFIDDLDAKIEYAELSDVAKTIGKDSSGTIKALPYENTSGLFYYRRSIAREVFGSDDPMTIMEQIGAGTGDWNKYLEACEILKAHGYAMTSSLDDVWNPCNYGASTPWVTNGSLSLDPSRAVFLDLSRIMSEGGYTNGTGSWTKEWENDMAGIGTDQKTGKMRQVFSFMGPLWFLHYTMQYNCEAGSPAYNDWGVCMAPVSFVWGGSAVLARKDSVENKDKKEFISRFVEWLTLDCTQNGFQYSFASGACTDGICNGVTSTKVMNMLNVSDPFLGNAYPHAFLIKETISPVTGGYGSYNYSGLRDAFWSAALSYASGDMDRDAAIKEFQENAADFGEIDVNTNFVVPDNQLTTPEPYDPVPTTTPTPPPTPTASAPTPTPKRNKDKDKDPTPTRARGRDTSKKKKKTSSSSDEGVPTIVYVLAGVGSAVAIAGTVTTIVLVHKHKKKKQSM